MKILSNNPYRKVLLDDNLTVRWFIPHDDQTMLKTRYNVDRFKFPQISFFEKYIEYKYQPSSFLKNVIFYARCFYLNKFYSDDRLENVRNGVLIDFEELNYVSRWRIFYMLHVYGFDNCKCHVGMNEVFLEENLVYDKKNNAFIFFKNNDEYAIIKNNKFIFCNNVSLQEKISFLKTAKKYYAICSNE